MSTVYFGYDVAADRHVAVKLLSDHLATSREFVNRFYREARLSRLLSHPNLVRGHAAGYDTSAQKHYLALEFIDGPTAHAALLSHGKFSVGVAVQTAIDIASALEFLHSRNYVHRDVKPDNVLFHPDGVSKLADLGLAKRLNDDAQLTTVNRGLGTSYYMAYEQSLNADLVDGRSDIFALGATLYHLLAGVVPFPGTTHEEITRGKQRNLFVPVNLLNPQVPACIAGIVSKALALDPNDRFQTASEFARILVASGLAVSTPHLGKGTTVGDSRLEVQTRTDLNPTVHASTDIKSSQPPTATYLPQFHPNNNITDNNIPGATLNGCRTRKACIALALLACSALAAVAGGAVLSSSPSHESVPDPVRRGLVRDIPQPPVSSDSFLPTPVR